MKKTLFGILTGAVAVNLLGCAPVLWVKPGGTQAEFDGAKYECMQAGQQAQAQAPPPCANLYGQDWNNCMTGYNLGALLVGTPGQQMYGACMNAHGWHLQTVPRS